MKMEGSQSSTTVITTRSSPYSEFENFSRSTFLYDRHFIRTIPGFLIFAEIVFGLLVWMLIAGTEYFRVSVFGWVMFVAVVYWVLTVFFLIMYLTMAYTRIPQVPWTKVGLGFNSSAALLYLVAAILDATSLRVAPKGGHNFNSWAASTFFAFLVTLCYAGSAYFSFLSWKSKDEERQQS